MDGSDGSRRKLVIVALPPEADRVRNFSSEKQPHLTLLYLGKPDYDAGQIAHIAEYVDHASSLLHHFTLEVESRGVLGDENADVLFFYKDGTRQIMKFREQLLQDPLISAAYHSTDQFPEWTPHLTMGYPENPAKKDSREYPGFTFVEFDRVALWTSDSDGPTFQLKRYSMEVAMSQLDRGRAAMDDLMHYGVKGMKWGVRRSESQSSSTAKVKPPASEDHTRVVAARAKSKTGGTKALSNKELQDIVTRMNLEQQYAGLVSREPTKLERGQNQVKKTLSLAKTAQDVYNVVNSPAGKALRKAIIGV